MPGGTVHPNERPDDAVMREALEETGLTDLSLGAVLGEEELSPAPGMRHHRYYYHLACRENPPERWQHFETDPSEGDEGRILFELYWVRLPKEAPQLSGGLDRMLPRLLDRLRADARERGPSFTRKTPARIREKKHGRPGSRPRIHRP